VTHCRPNFLRLHLGSMSRALSLMLHTGLNTLDGNRFRKTIGVLALLFWYLLEPSLSNQTAALS
jgi:hypothetical protein